MRKLILITASLLIAGGVWADYWDYDGCGHDQKPCLTKEGKFHGIVDIYNAYYSDGVLVSKQTWVDGELKSSE